MENKQANILKIAKGICIFFVVFGHTMIPSIRDESKIINDIWIIIYIFHMPAFFAISGILFQLNLERYLKSPIDFLKKKIKLLIVPYITISILVYLFLFILKFIPGISFIVNNYVHNIDNFINVLFEIITYENHVAQHLWFLLVLFFIFCVNILMGKIHLKWMMIIFIILPIISLPLLKNICYIPDIPNYFLFEIPFFMIGRIIGKKIKFLKNTLSINFSPIIFCVLTCIYFLFVDSLDILPDPIRWVFMFCLRCSGIFMIFSVSAFLEKNKLLKRILMYLGEKSFPIYLFHQPFIVSGGCAVLSTLKIPTVIVVIIGTILGLIIPLLIDKLFNKIIIYRSLFLGEKGLKEKYMKNLFKKIKKFGFVYLLFCVFEKIGIIKNKYSNICIQKYFLNLPESKRTEELMQWYKNETGKDLNLENPSSFNEKIQWMKLYDSTQLKTELADKYLVRGWVEKTIGHEYLIPLLGVWDKFDEINFSVLPSRYVLKCNHGSGTNLIVNETYPINISTAKKTFDFWMKRMYGIGPMQEWHYKNIPHKIIAEKYMENAANDLYDYKFYCFNGEPYLCQVIVGRNIDAKMAFYDLNWKKTDCFYHDSPFKKIDYELSKPKLFDKTVKLVRELCKGFCFVRVDMYILETEIYFGEMTFTPASGIRKWCNDYDYKLGAMIILPKERTIVK